MARLLALLLAAALTAPHAATQEVGRRVVPVQVPSRAPVRGVVVEAGTGRRIPHLRVLLAGDGTSEQVVTDGEGGFTTTATFRAVLVTATVGEDQVATLRSGGLGTSFVHDASGAGEPHVIELPVSPRFELDVALPPGAALEDYRAHLQHLRIDDDPNGYGWSVADVRRPIVPGGLPWVRFEARFGAGHDGAVLWLLRRDGLAGARVELTDAQRAGADDAPPVALAPRPLGALTVRVRSAVEAVEGDESPRVRLVPVGGEGALARPRELHVQGERRIPWLEPGTWTVELTSPHAEGDRAEVRIDPAAEAALDLALGARRPSGTVVVRVVRAQGDFEPWEEDVAPDEPMVSVRLHPRDPTGRTFLGQMDPECGLVPTTPLECVSRAGRQVLEVTFEDVSEGVYDLVGRVDRGHLSPGQVAVRPGNEATLTLHEGIGAGGYGFRLVVPEGEEARWCPSPMPLTPTDRPFPLSGGGYMESRLEWIAARELPPGDPVPWCLHVPGFERAYGDWRSFVLGPDGVRRAEVRLAPGWSLRLRAEDRCGLPLGGVYVSLRGEPQGWTDADGVLLLRAPTSPHDPRLAFDGWRPAGGDLDLDGRFREPRHGELRAVLARP